MTTYTTNLGLALPVTGDLTGTWGDTVNNAITSLLDSAVAGTTTLSSDADVTLTDTTGAANQARQAIILWTAGGTVTRNITAPARTKAYVVINATSGSQSIVLRGTGPTTGVTVVAGERCLVAWNGTDFVKVGSGVGLASNNAFTGANTFHNATGQTFGTATATQDGFIIGGRAGGSSTYRITFTPGTLTANRTLTFPDATDTVAVLGAAQTFTGQQTFAGSASTLAVVLSDAAEVATVSATAATGTINYDLTTQSVLYYTSNASANWTVNFRASSGTSLNTALATGQSITAAFLVTQGATAYFNNVVQVDGTTSGVTTRWIGGAPTAGNASGIDSYRYLIIKTGSATFTVLASVNQFKA